MPELHAQVDFSVKVDFMKQELFQQIMRKKSGGSAADQLVKVQLKTGEDKWILIHLEVQGSNESVFAERMFQYFYRIYDSYPHKIVTLAIMTSPHDTTFPTNFRYEFFGTELFFTYNNRKLIDYKDDELEQSDQLFSKIILAAKSFHATKKDAEKRLEMKEKLMAYVVKSGHYTDVELQAAIYFIDYLLQLPKELTEELHNKMVKVIEKEESNMIQHNSGEWSPTMEAVFSHIREDAEKVGMEKGLEQGKEQAFKKVALELLKVGSAVDYVVGVTGLKPEVVEKLKESL